MEPMQHWPNAVSCFKSHESAKDGFHAECFHHYNIFLNTYSGKQIPVNALLQSTTNSVVSKNRQSLVPIIDTVQLCGRLGLPFRGHRNTSSDFPEVGGDIWYSWKFY